MTERWHCTTIDGMSEQSGGRVLIVLAHPNRDSLNHALSARAAEAASAAGYEPHLRDLYAEGFDPVLQEAEVRRRFPFDETIQAHFRDVQEAAGFVFVHPDWWGQPPAILKGWLDRVFRPGVAYDFEGEEFLEKKKVPLLTGRWALVLSTTDAVKGKSPHPLESIWSEQIFAFCGIAPHSVEIMYDVRNSTGRMRRAWLKQVGTSLHTLLETAAERRAE